MHNVKQSTASSCRFCGEELLHTFVDLGVSPLCESYVSQEDINNMEPFYPLHAYVCENCYLVQLEEYVKPENIFSEYAYFSSYADSWVEHARIYTEMVIDRFSIDNRSQVTEIASNDGYLLQHFVKKGITVLGIEPAANVAKMAIEKNIPTLVKFFNTKVAKVLLKQGYESDLLIGNNVLAQVSNLKDFVKAMKILLKPLGIITMEFPHLMRLVEGNQFDTIYHEHFSYFSFITVDKIFASHGLTIFDVEELETHGGSLRIFARHAENERIEIEDDVEKLRNKEDSAGVLSLSYYYDFQEKVKETKRQILEFFIGAKRSKKVIVGYGAPGKGNTLLNYCGIRTDFLDYVVDRNPYKQGKFLPGTHIPIYEPERIKETRPDYVVIMPWNFKEEIMRQISFIREWGAKFVVFIPDVKIYD